MFIEFLEQPPTSENERVERLNNILLAAERDSPWFRVFWNTVNYILRGNGALISALYDDNMELFNTLLAAGAKVNHVDNDGYSALMIASFYGNTDEINALLAAGANVNHVNNYGYSALTIASVRGNTDAVNALLAAGANVNHVNNDGDSALTLASARGNTDAVNALLAAGANVNHVDNIRKFSVLMHASLHGHTDSVNALLAAGANVNYVDKNGDGALAVASWNDHTDVVRLLLIKGRPIITAECVSNVANDECAALIEKYKTLSLIATIASAAPLTLLRKAKAEQQGNSPYVPVPAVSKIHAPNLGPGEGWAPELLKMIGYQPQ